MENYTKVYPFASFVGASSNALGVTLLGMLYDSTGAYTADLILCMSCQVIVILMLFTLLRKKQAAKLSA